jgi:hypothetical protein
MRRAVGLTIWGAISLGLLFAGPGAAAPVRPSGQAIDRSAQVTEDLRQLDTLLAVTPDSLQGQDAAALEEHLHRLLLLGERLRQPGALAPSLLEPVNRKVLDRSAQVVAILRQHRAAPAADPPERAGGALAVLGDFAVGLARQPLLLGGTLAAAILLFACGIQAGQRRAWGRPPATRPTPSLARAVAALQPAVAETALDVRRARQAVAGGRPLLLSLSYEVRGERRAEYLATMERLRDRLARELGYAYVVWEQDGRPNWFTEMVLCTTPQEFDRLAGPDDSVTRRLLEELGPFLRDPAQVGRTALMGMAAAPAAAPAAGGAVARRPDAVLDPDKRKATVHPPAREVPFGSAPAEAA